MLENDDRTNQSGEENEDLLRIIIRKAFNNVDSKGTDSTKKLNKSNPAFDSTRPSSKVKQNKNHILILYIIFDIFF